MGRWRELFDRSKKKKITKFVLTFSPVAARVKHQTNKQKGKKIQIYKTKISYAEMCMMTKTNSITIFILYNFHSLWMMCWKTKRCLAFFLCHSVSTHTTLKQRLFKVGFYLVAFFLLSFYSVLVLFWCLHLKNMP